MCLYVNARIHMQIQYACVCVCVRVAGPYRQRLRLTTCSAEQEVQFYLTYFQALADATEIAQPANATHTQCVSLNRTQTHTHTHAYRYTLCVRAFSALYATAASAVEPCNPWHFSCMREVFFSPNACVYMCLPVCQCVCVCVLAAL